MLRLVSPPADPCVTLAEAKLHLRVDASDDDALITSLVVASTQEAEHTLGRALMTQAWQLVLDSFFDPGIGPFAQAVSPLCLSKPPVSAVTSVTYAQASDGTDATVDAGDYRLVTGEYASYLYPAYGKSWPAPRAIAGAVRVDFVTGVASAANVPELVKAWIKLRVGTLYECRQADKDPPKLNA
ncbi:MAG: head-tail connector protein, partial [Rubrivivax sp.]